MDLQNHNIQYILLTQLYGSKIKIVHSRQFLERGMTPIVDLHAVNKTERHFSGQSSLRRIMSKWGPLVSETYS